MHIQFGPHRCVHFGILSDSFAVTGRSRGRETEEADGIIRAGRETAEGTESLRAPCRCVAASLGARVARLRCPILRTGRRSLPAGEAVGKKPLK